MSKLELKFPLRWVCTAAIALLAISLTAITSAATASGLINFALGPLAGGTAVYSGPGPVVGTTGDQWNAISLATSGTTTFAPLTSGALNDSDGNITGVTVQIGTNSSAAKIWSTTSSSGELGALVQNYIAFNGADAIMVHGLDATKSYNLYCFNGPKGGAFCEVMAGGVTNSMTDSSPSGTPWIETQQFIAFTNVTTDTSGNLTINIGLDNNSNLSEDLCGFQLQAISANFTVQPQSQPAPPGSTVKFSVAVTGGNGPPAFRWQQNIGGIFTNLSDGGNVSGSATATLSIANVSVTNAGSYRLAATIGTLTTNSVAANLAVQSGALSANLTADTNSIFRNPFMGWVIYASDNGDIPVSSNFWNQVNTPFLPYASTCYIRVLWSEMEPQEGVYAWNNNANFIALVQGATARGIKLAFRVYVDSQDVTQQATPQWAFNAGVPVIAQADDGPDPDIRNSIFQNKFTTFINAFGAAFNDPSKVAFVDASAFGQWGEMNVSLPLAYMTNASDRAQVMSWLCTTYSSAFTRVPTAMNFPGSTWTDSEITNYCFSTGCTTIRRDGLGTNGYVSSSQESDIQQHWPAIPFIAEESSHDPSASEEVVVVAQALYLHANYLDLREPDSAWHKVGGSPGLVKNFYLYGGYRFSVGTVNYTGIIQPNSNTVFQATIQNWGAGILPNNLKPWNYKYKFAYALLDTNGNPVSAIVDAAMADDPSRWTNGTAYIPPLASGIPSGLMGNYWQSNSKSYLLAVTNNFGDVAVGNYYLGVAIVDTSNTNKVDITLANIAPRSASGWMLVGPVIVASAPGIMVQPQSQIAPVGATVQFGVTATGTPAPAFQWKRNSGGLSDGVTGNGSTISGTAAGQFTLFNAQTSDSGNYSVTLTNAVGVTNSMSAQLLVIPPATVTQSPWLTNDSAGGQFQFSFAALPGYRYLVQRSTNLVSPKWLTRTNLPPNLWGYPFTFAENFTNAAAFYRIYLTNQ